jgi:hypothetical protein
MDLATGLTFMAKGAHQMPEFVSRFSMTGKVVMIVLGLFWVIMLLHCLRRKFKVDIDKLAWVLLLLFMPGIGAFLYLFAVLFMFKKRK